jgi:protease-4
MNKKTMIAGFLILFLGGCAAHFHLDFLGEKIIEEVVLIQNNSPEKILILDVSGALISGVNPGIFQREGNILSRIFYRLEKASEDKYVKGIILRLDTPGGDVTTSDILYNEIIRFREKTGVPVVGLMMGIAASGGYYIASGCDYVMAHPSTLTGSIGVISIFPNVEDLISAIGIKVNVIKSGKMKDSGSVFKKMTETDKEVYQGIIDDYFKKFLSVVLKGRKGAISEEELLKIADGRVYTAQQALKLKLIDQIGYFDQALEKTESLAGIKKANVITYTYYPKSKTNIYATAPEKPVLFEKNNLQDLLPNLKSGFYYLWLPDLLP